MKRSILMSLLVIGAAVAMLGATLAIFNDEELGTGAIDSEAIDLKVDGADDPLGPIVSIQDMGTGDIVVKGPFKLCNIGSSDGMKDLHFNNVQDFGDGINEPECEAEGGVWTDPTCSGNVAVDDISNHIGVDYQQDDVIDGACTGTVVWLGKLKAIESITHDIGPLPAGQCAELCLSFHLQDVDNRYQDDKTTFDILFTLHE